MAKPSSAGSWRRITARQHGISLTVRILCRLKVHSSEFRAGVEFRGLQDQGSTDVIAVSETESIPRFAQLVADKIRHARAKKSSQKFCAQALLEYCHKAGGPLHTMV